MTKIVEERPRPPLFRMTFWLATSLLSAVSTTPHEAKRAAYERSAAACRHGHADGVIVTLHEDAHPREYLAKLRARALEGDEFQHTHFDKVGRYVAATLSRDSLTAVFADEHALHVHADCIVRLQPVSEAKILTPPAAAKGAVDLVGQFNVSAGVLRRSASSPERWNWGPDRVDSTSYRDNQYRYGTATGRGTRLYHLDTGIYLNHAEFGGRARRGYSAGCPTGREKQCNDGWLLGGEITEAQVRQGQVCDGHGTHTATTAVGSTFGIAKEASVISVQSLDCTGSATNSQVLMAFEWAVNDALSSGEPSVITLSLGGEYSEFLNKGTTRVVEYGIPVIVASGNDGANACQTSPASTPAAITVGGTDMEDGYASYSNNGPCVDIHAPGSEIVAGYVVTGHTNAAAVLSGTSMATPHVAGAALQMLQLHPTMRPDDVKRSLLCMASTNVIHGLDAYTPNRLLHTGEALSFNENVRLLNGQIRRPAVPVRHGQANFSGFEYTSVGNAEAVSPSYVAPDATTCLAPMSSEHWHGASRGSDPAVADRVMGMEDVPRRRSGSSSSTGQPGVGSDAASPKGVLQPQ